jgi:sugar lactone lactonase YvrE
LYFVDIKGRELLRWNENRVEGSVGERMPLVQETGAVALCHAGGLIAARRDGFARITLAPLQETPYAMPQTDPAEPVGNRFNDGKCDAAGRFWAASMDDACRQPSGAIWSLAPDGRIRRHLDGFIVGNGFGWSRDNCRMYFTDSENRRIMTYDFDLHSGEIGPGHCFAEVAPADGYPDGLTVDAEDHVWSAHWDGGRITRYRPDGSIERVVSMPVPRPTSLTFGGPGYRTLFITSARTGLTPEQLDAAPLSGALFALDTDCAGLPPARFGLASSSL